MDSLSPWLRPGEAHAVCLTKTATKRCSAPYRQRQQPRINGLDAIRDLAFSSAFDKQQHERLFNRPWQILTLSILVGNGRCTTAWIMPDVNCLATTSCGVNTAHRVIGEVLAGPKSGIAVAVHSLSMRQSAGVSVG